jgi:lipopolysaccharide exporter
MKNTGMPKIESLHKSTILGSLLNYLAFILNKGTTFISTVILTRLLSPDDFGLMTLGLFIIYFEGLSDFGVGAAVIYRQQDDQEIEDRTSSIAFIFNVMWGFLLAALVYFCAPEIALFFHESRVLPIIQVLAASFIITSLGNIHEARLRKALLFRRRFIAEVAKSLAKAGISIGLALNGFGVWSLVWGQLAGSVIATTSYWMLSGWHPTWTFDIRIFRSLLGYGSQIATVLLLGTLIQNLDYLLIGRRQDAAQLGIYTMAFRLPELVILNICTVISPVLFPAYARLHHDKKALQTAFLSTTRYISLISFPLGIGTAIISPDFVRFFFTERWEAAIPVMQVLALYATAGTIGFNVGDIYKAMGRPVILNKLAVIHLAMAAPALWYASGFDILTVAWAQLITTLFIMMLRIVIAARFLKLKLWRVFAALLPAVTGVLVMAASLIPLASELASFPLAARLAILVLGGALTYTISLMLLHRRMMWNLFAVLRASLAKS